MFLGLDDPEPLRALHAVQFGVVSATGLSDLGHVLPVFLQVAATLPALDLAVAFHVVGVGDRDQGFDSDHRRLSLRPSASGSDSV